LGVFTSQMKHFLKLYKSKNFEELNLIKSIKNIKKEHYAYNKDSYKKKKNRILKTGI